jgi:hypothetical protein
VIAVLLVVVRIPKANGTEVDRGIHNEEQCSKRPKKLKRPGQRSKPMPRI